MAAIHETAFPRFQQKPTQAELNKIFTPTSDEILFCKTHTKSPRTRIGILLLLKSFQRLGYFPQLKDIPQSIVDHITESAKIGMDNRVIHDYESNGYRYRHIPLIRSHLGVLPFSSGGQKVLIISIADAAQTKDALADLINCGIEALVAKRFELPGFSFLLRSSRKIRHLVNRSTYMIISNSIMSDDAKKIDELFVMADDDQYSFWEDVKQEPGRATQKNMKALANHLLWMRSLNVATTALDKIPYARYRRFVLEAKSLDAARMRSLTVEKRYTLAVALVRAQLAVAHDDLADMFVKSCSKMHWRARQKLDDIKIKRQSETDKLVALLAKVTETWNDPVSQSTRELTMNALLQKPEDEILSKCRDHMAYAGNNWLPLLPPLFNCRRQNFFRFIVLLSVRSSNRDRRLEKSVELIISMRKSKGTEVSIHKLCELLNIDDDQALEALGWIPDKWWKVITGQSDRDKPPESVNRKMLEICVFTCVMQDLKSGDLFIPNGDNFGDWRSELIDDTEYKRSFQKYCKRVSLPTSVKSIVESVFSQLTTAVNAADKKFPENEFLEFRDEELSLKRLRKSPEPPGFKALEKKISQSLPLTNIPQILMDTDRWIGWTKQFKPISGFKGKLSSPTKRYVSTVFCYGCNLGPSQTSRSLVEFDRKQISWVDERHIDEDDLQKAVVHVINSYNKFSLPKVWGDGKSASADGTQWDIFEKNLLSEYHIRYGGWGGIGYYHVSDTYVALFSNFISCGVWEGVHILDGIIENNSEVQPDTLHADTHGQSEAIFGLAHLLGIKLMPRIRNWKDLTFYLPDDHCRTDHLGSLFTGVIDWDLIERHMPDMLRIAISISRGRVAPSTILRRLNSSSRKSKLYFAFRELGRAIRTGFLLSYVNDIDLRRKIQAATNKSEGWNAFIQWVSFGGEGLRKQDRLGQHKLIRYNHLVSNLIVLHNIVHLTKSLNQFALQGELFTPELLAAFAPYKTNHINRFGRYELNDSADNMDLDKVDLSFDINSLRPMC